MLASPCRSSSLPSWFILHRFFAHRPSLTAQIAIISGVLTCAFVQAHATSEHTYKKNEYLVIERGRAPNKLLSIASHGKGEGGRDDFHLYLMAEPAHRKIAQLPGIDDVLDTAPDAYEARWTPDSRHVAVGFRSDRHIAEVRLYRIADRRAQLIPVPDLLRRVIKNASNPEYAARRLELYWLGPTKFRLEEDVVFRVGSSSPTLATLGAFGREPAEQNPQWPVLEFSAEAVCELVPGGTYRLVEFRPGNFRFGD
jgi:hypothetical protein